MRSKLLWLKVSWASRFLMGSLQLVDGGEAQQGKKGGRFGKRGDGTARAVTADQIVERIMAFDKNNDGKITLDELPERMQHLIALGDVNKDGALDKDEIRKLAVTLESFTGLTGGGRFGGFAGGPPRGPGPRPGGEVQRTLDELNLTGETKDKAQALARAYEDKIRRFVDSARKDAIAQMKGVLSEDDFKALKTALDRPPFRPGFGGPPPVDLERRIDQLQKEVDELRRKATK